MIHNWPPLTLSVGKSSLPISNQSRHTHTWAPLHWWTGCLFADVFSAANFAWYGSRADMSSFWRGSCGIDDIVTCNNLTMALKFLKINQDYLFLDSSSVIISICQLNSKTHLVLIDIDTYEIRWLWSDFSSLVLHSHLKFPIESQTHHLPDMTDIV
jgi:hypothetical protein